MEGVSLGDMRKRVASERSSTFHSALGIVGSLLVVVARSEGKKKSGLIGSFSLIMKQTRKYPVTNREKMFHGGLIGRWNRNNVVANDSHP